MKIILKSTTRSNWIFDLLKTTNSLLWRNKSQLQQLPILANIKNKNIRINKNK